MTRLLVPALLILSACAHVPTGRVSEGGGSYTQPAVKAPAVKAPVVVPDIGERLANCTMGKCDD